MHRIKHSGLEVALHFVKFHVLDVKRGSRGEKETTLLFETQVLTFGGNGGAGVRWALDARAVLFKYLWSQWSPLHGYCFHSLSKAQRTRIRLCLRHQSGRSGSQCVETVAQRVKGVLAVGSRGIQRVRAGNWWGYH